MKKLTIAIALLLWPSLASAYLGGYATFTKTLQTDTKHHAMIVYCDSLPNSKDLSDIENGEIINGLTWMLERAGIEVHVYSFRQLQANKSLWRFAGNTRCCGGLVGDGGGYAVAIVLNMYPDNQTWGGKTFSPYFNGDSTTTHVIEIGGQIPHYFREAGSAAAQIGHGILGGNNAAVNHYTAGTAYFDSMVVVADGSASPDTLNYDTINSATVEGPTRPTGVLSMVRLLRAANQPDSLCPAAWDGDWVKGVYRVYWGANPYNGASSAYVDYVFNFGNSANNSESCMYFVWALASRWIQLPTIKLALVMQGLAQFGNDPFWPSRPPNYGGSSPANLANWAYPRSDYVDAIRQDLRTRYHVGVVTWTTQPDSCAWLMANYSDWAAKIRSWAATGDRFSPAWCSWDSLGTMRSPTGDVSVNYADTTVANWDTPSTLSGKASRRVGHRIDPTNAIVAQKWGMVQSFAVGDSFLNALGLPICKAYIPLQLGSAGVIYGNDMPVGPFDYGNINLCPAETTMVAYADAKRYWIIENEQQNTSLAGGANGPPAPCRLQNKGQRWAMFPDEEYTTADGRKIRFLSALMLAGNIMGTTGNPATPGPFAIAAAGGGSQIPDGVINRNIALAMGFTSWRAGIAQIPTAYGRTTIQPGNSGNPSWGGVGRVRVIVCPIRFVGNQPMGWYQEYWLWKTVLFGNLKVLEDLAGHPLIEWVTPEQAAAAVP